MIGVLNLVCGVPVVEGGFRIRFGSSYLEPMSTTPQPLPFTSHCSSRELARPTRPWPCAWGCAWVGMCFAGLWFFFAVQTATREWFSLTPGERTEQAAIWLNTRKNDLGDFCLKSKISWVYLVVSYIDTPAPSLPGGATSSIQEGRLLPGGVKNLVLAAIFMRNSCSLETLKFSPEFAPLVQTWHLICILFAPSRPYIIPVCIYWQPTNQKMLTAGFFLDIFLNLRHSSLTSLTA